MSDNFRFDRPAESEALKQVRSRTKPGLVDPVQLQVLFLGKISIVPVIHLSIQKVTSRSFDLAVATHEADAHDGGIAH
jgi:hypothetical protein